jgi:hypothetical protein
MKKHILLIAIAAFGLSSCNDFLEREPLDFGNEDAYYNTVNDLKIAANDLYQVLPTNNRLRGGIYTEDTNSDNQCGTTAASILYRGNKRTLQIDDSDNQWTFTNLRGINFFINKTESRYDEITGSESLRDHYLGEGYFFRAYEYFRLLRNFGDAPIFTEMLPDDHETLLAATKRYPRNEVARFIIEQLDRAAELLLDNAPESGRITKAAAYALKSRVALYEGTWEKYHAGTCFVPGNSKWVGASYWPDFTFKAGSAEAEVNYFFDEAIKAAELAVAGRHLDNDYPSMFNNFETAFGDDDEVILARYYQVGVLAHSASAYLKSGGGCGVTRAAVNSYLMTNGLPIYAQNSGYLGDDESYYEFQNRDERLTKSVRAGGRVINTVADETAPGGFRNDTIFYYLPYIDQAGNEKATTGYELCKYLSDDTQQQIQYQSSTAVPLLRVGECYLNYIEAYYERHNSLGGNCDQYWRALRTRAGVDPDYNKTIQATDLDQENDLAIWSKGKLVSPTLYNIRRERRCEMLAEGQRLDDLKRWRALDMMNANGMRTNEPDQTEFQGYQPEGINLWTVMASYYTLAGKKLEVGTVSQSSVSMYMRPLQANANANAYEGYNFPKPHYLEPIPLSEFLLTMVNGSSVLYQNPGWPDMTDGTADYSYDCD